MKLSLAAEEVTVSSVRVTITAEQVEEYAYLLLADGQGEFPEPDAIFRENDRHPISESEIRFQNLEAKTPYTLAVVARGGVDGAELRCEKVQFTTTDYTNMLTFTGIEKRKITFHVACQEDQYWKWAMFRYTDYVDRRLAFWPTESRMLPRPGLAEPQHGPATIEVEQTETFPILPGEKYILMVAECDAEGNYLYESNEQGGGGGGPAPLSTRSLEGGDEYTDEDVTWSGFYCRRIFLTEKPEPTELSTQVKEVKVTTRNATFQLTPDEGAYGFTAGILRAATYEEFKEKYTEEAMSGFIAYSQRFYTAPTEISYQDLEEGEYYILISTFADADATAQNIQIVPFRRSVPTKPKAQLQVKGIEAPAGETLKGPNYCWFNIKAPNKDAVYGTYLTMEHQEFLNQIQFGASVEQLISDFILQAQFTPEVLAGINSDAGYNIVLNAWEDTQYVLLAGIANDEDVVTVATGMSHTEPMPAEPRVESALFEELQGDWTVTATSLHQTETGWEDFLRITAKSTIHTAPPLDDVPATVPEEVYAAYEAASVSRPMVDAYFRDFKELGKKIGDKYRSWNRVVACGLELGWGSGWGQCWSESEYRSPWQLFSASDYNGSGNLDIYRDFGPKLFFHIGEGDKVTVIANTQTAGTASGWGMDLCIFATPEDFGQDGAIQVYDLVEFPVEVSEDRTKLTIKPMVVDGKKYYFSLGKAGWDGTSYNLIFRAKDDVVFTKGWTGADDKTIVEDLTGGEPAPAAAPTLLRMPGKTSTKVSPQHTLPSTYRPTVFRKVEGRVPGIDELTGDPTIESYANRK